MSRPKHADGSQLLCMDEQEIAQSEDFITIGDRTVHTRAYISAFNLKVRHLPVYVCLDLSSHTSSLVFLYTGSHARKACGELKWRRKESCAFGQSDEE